MSSLLRRIERMVPHTALVWDSKRGKAVVQERAGRKTKSLIGKRLGTVNPKDPCRTGKRKAPKPYRAAKFVTPKPKISMVPSSREIELQRGHCRRPSKGADRDGLRGDHSLKMAEKARRRAILHASANEPERVMRLLMDGVKKGTKS